MKKFDLNRNILDVSGNVMTVAQLQRRVMPTVDATSDQEKVAATFASIAYPAIENQRGRQMTDSDVKLAFSTLKKINAAVVAQTIVELEDDEAALVVAVFGNQVISIRAQFIAMSEELNPVATN